LRAFPSLIVYIQLYPVLFLRKMHPTLLTVSGTTNMPQGELKKCFTIQAKLFIFGNGLKLWKCKWMVSKLFRGLEVSNDLVQKSRGMWKIRGEENDRSVLATHLVAWMILLQMMMTGTQMKTRRRTDTLV